MPFSLLNPWFLLGALAVAAPVWLHLRRRRETNFVPFSTLRFLDDQPEPRRSPLRLRDLLLLALRLLAVLALVGAFAWPYLRGASIAPVRESRVYILDNTLSHQANNGFDHDRDRILADLGKSDGLAQVAVIELRSVPRTIVSFGESRDAAKQKIRDLKPSFERGSYLAPRSARQGRCWPIPSAIKSASSCSATTRKTNGPKPQTHRRFCEMYRSNCPRPASQRSRISGFPSRASNASFSVTNRSSILPRSLAMSATRKAPTSF